MIKRVIVIAVLLLPSAFLYRPQRERLSQKNPKLPREQRANIAVFAAIVGSGSNRHHALASHACMLDRAPAKPSTRRASTREARCALQPFAAGALRCGTFVARSMHQHHWGVEPRAVRLAIVVAKDREPCGTREWQSHRAPVRIQQPQPLTRITFSNVGIDDALARPSKFIIA
jgi:hypothetical protein